MIIMLLSVSIRAEMVVIINAENEVEKLNKEEVIGLFMGRNNAFPNGTNAFPFDQDVQSDSRNDFYLKLTKKSAVQINAYWARLVFSGRATPPPALSNSEVTLSTVRENPGAIAYIDSKDIDSSVKVVYRF